VTLAAIRNVTTGSFAEWLGDRKNRRAIPHRLEECGYVPVRNPDAEGGLWVINGKRQAIYTKATLAPGERVNKARELVRS
jgi:hypothetical protein